MIVLELGKRDLNRIHCVDVLVYKYYRCSLYEFCQKYNYDELFIEIIKQVTSDYSYDKLSYFKVTLDDNFDDRYYKIEEKFTYGVDNRSVAERVVSLGVNWVVEDVIVHKSSSVFLLTGCDSSRDLLVNPITSTPDIRYMGTGESFYVEVCSDFTNFMQRNRRYDLRKLKYSKLEDLLLVSHKRTLLLFVDVIQKQFYCAWFSPRNYSCFDKYLKNTVAFEFDESVVFKDLMDLFELCKKNQPDSSLYSNFNIDEAKGKKSGQGISYGEDWEDDGYWQSLFENEPLYVKTRVVDEDEINGVYKEIEDPYADIDRGYRGRDYNESDRTSGDRGLEEIKEGLGLEFKELPSDTYTPFDLGPEPPEREEIDTSENPFAEDYGYIDDPFSGEGLPF